MVRRISLTLLLLWGATAQLSAQAPTWVLNLDSVSLFTSPQLSDLNGDSILDVIVGGGVEGVPISAGITAVDGQSGQVLWQQPARDQVFGTALLRDITGDQVDDVFLGGRDAVLYALNGATGQVIWEFWPDSLGPAAPAGWYQWYNPQWVPDQNQDGLPDLLISNGGDRYAVAYDSLRPPGALLLLSTADGSVIARDTMPDGHETYFSPLLLDEDGTGDPLILFGSGGETVRGRLWLARLSELRNGDLSGAQILLDDTLKGMIASPSLADLNGDAVPDIIVPELNGRLTALNGNGFAPLWSLDLPGYEMYTAPAIGRFTGDATPDIFVLAARGQWSFYADYLEIVVDGATGQIAWQDSATHYQFSQANAVDRDGDGWDEVLLIRNRDQGFSTVEYRNQFRWIDVNDNQVQDVALLRNGLNIFSTPILADMDGDGLLELVYGYHPLTSNWAGITGAVMVREELGIVADHVAWPGYMGRDRDGRYHAPVPLEAAEAGGSVRVRVFPNPVHGVLRVAGGQPLRLVLRDVGGRVVAQARAANSLDLGRLSAGLYVLEVELREGRQWVKVVVSGTGKP